MDYQAALDYLFSQLPMYQRSGPLAYKPDLGNTLALMDLTGHQHEKLACVHIAGTNGKGSTSHMIAAVLQSAGYKTGLYTSPHLKDFRERIRIDGKMMDPEAVTTFVEQFKDGWSQIKPSFFEITVAMAFWYFEREKVDIAVIETGLGGRLDSTNVIMPLLSVITNISMDHMNLLGDTIEAIAGEKAGIIKPGRPLVLGKMNLSAKRIMLEKAAGAKCTVHDSQMPDEALPATDLLGKFQLENRKTALTAIGVLNELGFVCPPESINKGMANVGAITGLRGRWQILKEKPFIVADCGHNEAGIEAAMEELFKHSFSKLHIVLGLVADKDLSGILSRFPKDATYFFCRANIPRGLDAEELRARAAGYGLQGEAYGSVAKAYEAARLYADRQDAIFIGGSFFTVAEIL